MVTGAYERELKGILSGDEVVIEKATKTCDEEIKKAYNKIAGFPFMVTRAAGSFGVDIVAIRGDISFPIEVKASKTGVLRFSESSGRATIQANDMLVECNRSGVIPIYAFRKKRVRGGDSWAIFTLPGAEPSGTMGILYRRLPKIRTTPGGHYVMEWEEGMPLYKFIDYLSNP